ncbi:hypothetical protein ACFFWE_30165 [Sphaerisporangium melleum]|nr:hypothetical protein [Sphaerisporangium melleum]
MYGVHGARAGVTGRSQAMPPRADAGTGVHRGLRDIAGTAPVAA